MNRPLPKWVAHRGQSVDYPENTLASISAALRCGAEYIEIDIQCSSDGVPFLMHDPSLNRTTGHVGNLTQMLARKLRCISAHEPDRFGSSYLGECIPSLEDVAVLLAQWPTVTLFVEVKIQSIRQQGVDRMLRILHQHLEPVSKQVVLISFSLPFVIAARQQGIYSVGWILESYDQNVMKQACSLSPDYLIIAYMKVAQEQALASGDWEWMVYEINDADFASNFLAENIHLVETSDICRMLRHPD